MKQFISIERLNLTQVIAKIKDLNNESYDVFLLVRKYSILSLPSSTKLPPPHVRVRQKKSLQQTEVDFIVMSSMVRWYCDRAFMKVSVIDVKLPRRIQVSSKSRRFGLMKAGSGCRCLCTPCRAPSHRSRLGMQQHQTFWVLDQFWIWVSWVVLCFVLGFGFQFFP